MFPHRTAMRQLLHRTPACPTSSWPSSTPHRVLPHPLAVPMYQALARFLTTPPPTSTGNPPSAIAPATPAPPTDVAVRVNHDLAPHALHLNEDLHGRTRIYALHGVPGTKSATETAADPTLQWTWHDEVGEGATAAAARRWSGGLLSMGRAMQTFRSTFLPVGYPDSVHPSYLRFHLWKFTETAAGSCIGVLCSQAMLAALGIGGHGGATDAAAAAGGAVAVRWILKDGLGEIMKLLFIERFASQFDARVKSWKLVGEVASVTGALVSLLTAIAPSPAWFLPLASVGGALRSIHFSVWAAVHTTIARIYARRGNVGDIVAKDEAQLSVAHMLGSGVGVAVIALWRHDAPFLFTCYAALAPLQLWCSVSMLREAHFDVLNDVKVALLAQEWRERSRAVTANPASDPAHIALPCAETLASRPEHGPLGEWLRASPNIPHLAPGLSVARLFGHPTTLASPASIIRGAPADARVAGRHLAQALHVLRHERYLVRHVPSRGGTVGIAYRSDATARDMVKSIFHAIVLQEQAARVGGGETVRAFDAAYAEVEAEFPRFWSDLGHSPHWNVTRVYFDDKGIRFQVGVPPGSDAGHGERRAVVDGTRKEME
ncbi:hypothetical protein AMAG_11775 [Allomyces macrogynus ATCC 38327]|uniref:Protein root UVB sensitive/RUS domain-containing protein n=1 Tax=Allomyces macrogynus (strain ATCC 38327) TaxID=578462 RepID=A0A0L0SW10_ALLM3|nr:hypothetical protein AMAG_11775 [Allomyces macrogynus ATCC 38327]|eukprot:KNE66661.1 hypothetical protein AMAG_11775 [Allomyces macrogynus ATCC 38327]